MTVECSHSNPPIVRTKKHLHSHQVNYRHLLVFTVAHNNFCVSMKYDRLPGWQKKIGEVTDIVREA